MKNKKGMTLAEVLIYTALFSLLGMITIYIHLCFLIDFTGFNLLNRRNLRDLLK